VHTTGDIPPRHRGAARGSRPEPPILRPARLPYDLEEEPRGGRRLDLPQVRARGKLGAAVGGGGCAAAGDAPVRMCVDVQMWRLMPNHLTTTNTHISLISEQGELQTVPRVQEVDPRRRGLPQDDLHVRLQVSAFSWCNAYVHE
jgi:hypothetical protein